MTFPTPFDRPTGTRARPGVADADPADGGNVGSAVAALLGTLGLQSVEARATIEDVVTGELAARGHQAEVLDVRWGRLRLVAGPTAATLLRYDRDRLLDLLAERAPGAVTDLTVTVDPRRR